MCGCLASLPCALHPSSSSSSPTCTCCDRDVYRLGELYSYSGLNIPRQQQHNISLLALLGHHARLTIYDKGGNSTSARRLLRQLRRAGMAHMASASVVAMPNANGREAHTIAAHVEENFDALAAVTTFVQSDVMKLDHMMPIVHLREGLVAAAASIGTTCTASRCEGAAAIADRLASRMESATTTTTFVVGERRRIEPWGGPVSGVWPAASPVRIERTRRSREPSRNWVAFNLFAPPL